MVLDRKRLIQFMGMTFSSGDGEALTALRKANALLIAQGLSWAEVLEVKPPPMGMPSQSWRTPPSKRGSYGSKPHRRRAAPDTSRNTGDDIAEMLAELAARKHDMHTMMFIASINDHWERNSYLTDPQYGALKNVYNGGRW
jgi:hypothetical protein